MHGWRETMEDAHTVCLSLPKHTDAAYFGIFDGHSGSLCSIYIAEKLVQAIDDLPSIFDQEELARVCMECDQSFLDAEEFKHNEDGCAGIFSIVQKTEDGKYNTLHANIGDSRTILAKWRSDGTGYDAVACTWDHKPTDSKERTRIENAGGTVSMQRVDGQLALSRAFGDRLLKTPKDAPGKDRKVTSNPDFSTYEATSKDFLLLCCDGIYEADIFDRQDVIDWVAKKMETTDDLAKICADLLDECLSRGSHDNMSAMIVQLQNGESYSTDKPEYIPGPWFAGERDAKFQSAYASDALAAGYTLEQAHEMRKKIEQENNTNNSGSNTETV
jgi:serine/threonine protein phosphatase PrpC